MRPYFNLSTAEARRRGGGGRDALAGALLQAAREQLPPAVVVEDLDALRVALGALYALSPRCEVVVVVHDGRLKALDAVGATQRREAHLKHK